MSRTKRRSYSRAELPSVADQVKWGFRRLGVDAWEVMVRDPDQRLRRVGFVRRNVAKAYLNYTLMRLSDEVFHGGNWVTWHPFGEYEYADRDWVAIDTDGRVLNREVRGWGRAGELLVEADALWRSTVDGCPQ